MNDFLKFLALVFLAFWLFKRDRQKALGFNKYHVNTQKFPLKKGKEGHEVIQLRKFMADKYQVPFTQSAVFDTALEEALKTHLKRDNVSCNYYTKNKIYQHGY